jgi:hypothetical protein
MFISKDELENDMRFEVHAHPEIEARRVDRAAAAPAARRDAAKQRQIRVALPCREAARVTLASDLMVAACEVEKQR